jgi:hypothetical protein
MSESKSVRKSLPVAEADPRQGCLLFSIGGLVILTLVVWGAFTFFKQKQAILGFADTTQQSLAVPTVDAAAQTSGLAKLTTAEADPKDGSLTLEAAECIALFNSSPLTANIRQNAVLEKVAAAFHFNASLPLPRLGVFIHGQVTAQPSVDKDDGLGITSTLLEVPGKTVPSEFSQGYHEQGFFGQLIMPEVRKNPQAGNFLRRVKTAALKDGKLVLEYYGKK